MFRSSKGNASSANGRKKDGLSELRGCISKLEENIDAVRQETNIIRFKQQRVSNGSQDRSSGPKEKGGDERNGSHPGDNDEERASSSLDDIHFAPFDAKRESDTIELLRRIAELVIHGEKRAGKETRTGEGNNSGEILTSNAVFEYFCEVNVLGLIVDIVNGTTFRKQVTGGVDKGTQNSEPDVISNGSTSSQIFLPPISITTQAIQSVSILFQNVSKATSLYFLLSNNRVNDLINLPLHFYEAAEGNMRPKLKSNKEQYHPKRQSAEISELSTHFVTFLKSLAMQMNKETLQFFLTYPNSMGSDDNTSSNISVDFPLYARALDFCSPEEDTFVRITAMNLCLNTLRLAAFNGVECKQKEQSDRPSLVTQHSIHGSFGDGDVKVDDEVDSPDPNDKVLPFRERFAICHFVCKPSHVQSLMSPIFTKLARLSGLIEETMRSLDKIDDTLSTSISRTLKITELKGRDNEQSSLMNNSDGIDLTLLEIDEQSQLEEEKKRREGLQIERIRIVKFFHEIVDDFQDEVLLLEDVLCVGLVPLNEQIIEMTFAALIYPLILQPLHLCMQRNKTTAPTNSELLDSQGSCISVEIKGSPLVRDESTTGLVSEASGKKEQSEKDLDENTTCASLDPESSSLSKTALFVFASMFHLLSHEPLLHLLLTALFHPVAPQPSNDIIAHQAPTIVTTDKAGNKVIRVDQADSRYLLANYCFGKDKVLNETGALENSSNNQESSEGCTFILTPGLCQIFDCAMSDSEDPSAKHISMKPNPYRRSLLACLSATDGMSALQSLAIFAIDSMMTSLEIKVMKNVLFGESFDSSWAKSSLNEGEQKDNTKNSSSNCMVEVIASMCVSVMSSSNASNGLLKLNFSRVASHAIYCATIIDESARITASKLVDHRRRQSASFLSQLPSRLSKFSSFQSKKDDDSLGDESKSSIDEHLKMDRIFFDPFCDKNKCVVETLFRKQDGDWIGPGFASVAKDTTLDDLRNHVCEDFCSRKSLNSLTNEEENYRCAANSAIAYIQLESFSKLLRDKIDFSNAEELQKYSGVLRFVRCNKNAKECTKNGDRLLLSPLSSTFQSLLFDEEEAAKSSSSVLPEIGQILPLVGRTAFPCVCEVLDECEHLFTDGSCVVADGVKWQSLFLVFWGKYMILAEPVKGGSSGNGRVVTSCKLSCLLAEKDESPEVESASPARRLFLTQFSLESKAAGLFRIDKADLEPKNSKDEVRITRTGVDLWFEDVTSAGKAYKSLCSKILKARSKRGKRIKEMLVQDDRLRFSTLLSGNGD